MDELMEFMKKEFYIVDCEDFVYFAKTIHVVGFSMSSSEDELMYLTDQDTIMSRFELERYKTFEEAQAKAKDLNEKPENKKRAEDWFKNRQGILEFKYHSRKEE